jgi:hypothetical protein
MAETSKALALRNSDNAVRTGEILDPKGQQRTSDVVRTKKSSIRVRDHAQDGLETITGTVTLTTIYAKIASHWAPPELQGNAADDYGLGWIE